MQLAKNVHRFETGPFNWYVIQEDSRLTLVDAGFPGHYPVFREGIAALGRTLKDVEAIVITHAHADHTGFAERVRRETNAPLFIHKADLAKAGRILQLPWFGLLSHAWRPYTAAMLLQATVNGVFTLPSISKAIPFEDGGVLDIPGRPRAIHVPGHTPGETALLLPGPGVLLSGDALVTVDLFTGRAGVPQITGDLLTMNTQHAVASLDKLAGLGPLTMLPGHGKPWTGDMRDAVRQARELHAARPEARK